MALHIANFYTCDNCGKRIADGIEPLRFEASLARPRTEGDNWHYTHLCISCATAIGDAIAIAAEKAALGLVKS